MEGYCLVYEPASIVWHRHRRDRQKLAAQLENNGIGFYSHLVRSFRAYTNERISIVLFGAWWFYHWSLRRLLISIISPGRFPRDLIIKELLGSLKGIFRYMKSLNQAQIIDRDLYSFYLNWEKEVNSSAKTDETNIAVYDISKSVFPIDTGNFKVNLILVKKNEEIIDQISIENNYQEISPFRLIEQIAEKIHIKILNNFANGLLCEEIILNELEEYFVYKYKKSVPRKFSVSIVIATYERPMELKECLKSLKKIKLPNNINIIVVDNHPKAEVLSKVRREFPEVIFIKEERKGLSYARNKGILECKSDIVICIDDDVEVTQNWFKIITNPFLDENVMAVTGNIMPFELKNRAENLFELYGGLGRGFKKKYYDIEWFSSFSPQAVPTWEIGATANAAFRTSIFNVAEIGMFNESLGAGAPTGCSEDTYIFYKILKAGFSIEYEPNALVWHKHRKERRALKKQLYNYSKGHVAYNLLTFLNDKDYRGLFRIIIELPLAHILRILKRLIGKSRYPISYVLIEVLGNLIGPFSLFKSIVRVKKLGETQTYDNVLR